MGDLRFTQVKVYTRPSVSIHSVARGPLTGLEMCVPVCANIIQYPLFLTTGSYLSEDKIWGIFKMREILYQSSSLSALHFCAVTPVILKILPCLKCSIYELLWEVMPLNI